MRHALIIDDNMVVSRAIEDRLSAVGFDSFDHTWTEQQALEAAAQRRPDLIVIGDHVAGGSPLEVARELSSIIEAPIIAVTTDRFIFQRPIPEGVTIDGPYPLSDLDTALASAQAGD
jgi:DNA-binding response OmpR family regulator